jgi:hypothetical protein
MKQEAMKSGVAKEQRTVALGAIPNKHRSARMVVVSSSGEMPFDGESRDSDYLRRLSARRDGKVDAPQTKRGVVVGHLILTYAASETPGSVEAIPCYESGSFDRPIFRQHSGGLTAERSLPPRRSRPGLWLA